MLLAVRLLVLLVVLVTVPLAEPHLGAAPAARRSPSRSVYRPSAASPGWPREAGST
jgi:hypothetical protein